MTQDPEAHWLSAAEAAESVGITPRAFRDWQVSAVATIGNRKYFDGRAILENRLTALKRKHRRPETTTAELKACVDELETSLTNARAEGQGLRNAELRGELVRLDALTLAIANAATAANAALEALPGKIKRAAPEITGQELTEIRVIIARIQNQAADLDPKTLDMELDE